MDVHKLQRYIAYAKQKSHPRLDEKSAEIVKGFYVEDRLRSTKENKNKSSRIPITIRQLEAIIRLSEARAKVELSETVTQKHL